MTNEPPYSPDLVFRFIFYLKQNRRRFWTKMIYYMPLQTLYKILKIRGIKICFIKIVKRNENCVELKGVYFKKRVTGSSCLTSPDVVEI